MADGYKFQELKSEILLRSQSKEWELAKLEWKLIEVYESSEPETCLCTHSPIIEICVLQNTLNQKLAEVGNVCVKKFMGIRSDRVFACIKRISKDQTKALNAETISLFYQQGLIDDWERKFSLNTMRDRALSEKQMNARKKVNAKILSKTKNAKI